MADDDQLFDTPAAKLCASATIFCKVRDCKLPRIIGMAQKAHRFIQLLIFSNTRDA